MNGPYGSVPPAPQDDISMALAILVGVAVFLAVLLAEVLLWA